MLRFATAPISSPGGEPVTVAECKLDSRIDGTEYDSILPALISAAREMCEQETGRRLLTQTLRATAPDWPAPNDVFVASPFQSAVVEYRNGTGAWVQLPSTEWEIVEVGAAHALVPSYGRTFPSLGDYVGARVRVDVICGYGNAANVPSSLKMWIRAHVATMLRSPDGLGDEKKMAPLQYLQGLIAPHKVYA